MIQCTKCKEFKTEDCFVKDSSRPTGRFAWCKECAKDRVRRNRERLEVAAPESQRCNRCLETKPLNADNFGTCKSNFHGYQYECRPCKRARRRKAYLKDKEKEHAWSAQRRARQKTNGPYEHIRYSEVFKKSDGICGICGEPVEVELQHPDPMSGSIDHIEPISKGGLHVLENTQLAHLICNVRKGDRQAEAVTKTL